MGTLYDLLGALPNDNAEGLRTAFRKAAKATHPDLNPDNPEAALRFRQLVRAHDILSDSEQRATYDQLLAVATRPPPSKSKHVYEKVQRFASSTIAATIISGVLVAAYTLMGPVPPAPVAAESTVGIAARAPVDIAASGEAAGESVPRVSATPASEVFSTGSLASGASTRAWIAGAGPVPHVASNEVKSEPAIEVSRGTSKPPTLTDLQRDLGFLPLYSTRDVSRAFADMERTRRIAKTKQARAAEAQRTSTATILDAPPVLRLRRTRMTQAITP
jgi:DnaJ-like protein